MNDELPNPRHSCRSLDECFSKRPHTYQRLQEIAASMDQALAQGAGADEAEALALAQIQKLGGELLRDWAEARHDQALPEVRLKHPQSSNHINKE
jgi:hypothetical protein